MPVMSRLLRLRQIFSFGARAHPIKSTQPEVFRVQRVRFRKRRITTSTVLTSVGASLVIYHIVTQGLLIWVDEEEMTEAERQELEDDEEAASIIITIEGFIPFPGFTRTVQPMPYQSSDPEWLEFLKINRDKALSSSIRTSLAEMACRAVSRHPVLASRWGKDAAVSKFWLDINYPSRPPPTYVRQGLSISGDGIRWAERPVDSGVVASTRLGLWPAPLALALWSFTTALMAQNAATVAKFLGYETQTNPLAHMHSAMERLQQQMKKQSGRPSSTSESSPSQDRTGEESTTGSLPPVDKISAGSTTTPDTMGTGAGVDNAVPTVPSVKDMPMIRTAQEHTSGPWDSFKKSFAQNRPRLDVQPPRGSIRVSGLVEVATEHALITVDCLAWWNPKTRKFDANTTNLHLRAIRPKVQSAFR
ncbi:hypothetical protein F5Y14DRAFT_123796 [Nemania sp. NC0429]|nr:hypothetical protein F5Y14DRAFT_123796 [Nemania sp. NC0429]